MGMSIPYTDTGRTAQKQRTRDALVDAARELIKRGLTPTVEEAAGEASISRTTAYRYFTNQRELLVAAHPQIAERSVLPDDPPSDPAERLAIVLDGTLAMTLENEAALRAAFAISLNATDEERNQLLLRRGRTIAWLEEALEPLRQQLGARAIGRLARAIRATAGIEALIWLTDIGGLSRDEAVKLMKWSAQALLTEAIRSGAVPGR